MKEKKLGHEPHIHENVKIHDSQIGEWTEIGADSVIFESSFGDYSYCAGDNSIFYSTIGKFCSIAQDVRINPGNHPMDRVVQHHCTYRRKQYGFADTDDESFFDWRRRHHCTIGHDVWIGHGATVMAGVSIASGAVIGAGAVVTRDVAPYEIAVGVPAKPIRFRFESDIVDRLLSIAWWDWPREKMEESFHLLNDIQEFINTYG